MYDQIRQDTIFVMLYAIVMAMAAIASVYLLLRRGNAFAADITPPRRLRLWTAAFFGIMAVGHLWYLPAMVFDSSEAAMLCMLIGALLDCLLTVPVALIVMLCMLQDRHRPLWPVGVMVLPLVVATVVCIATHSYALVPWAQGYFLLMALGFTIYIVREVRQYGRWLRDNFVDLEHKEVWQSLLVLATIMLLFCYYVIGYGGMVYEYIIQVCGLFLTGYLLWRVETLPQLEHVPEEQQPQPSTDNFSTIEQLLEEYCVKPHLYLQHDLTLSMLVQALGTNRTYLGQYFSHQDTNYNAYINNLRINYFIKRYQEPNPTSVSSSVQQLAGESGYRSYSTFSLAFKQRMGKSVTAWIRESKS